MTGARLMLAGGNGRLVRRPSVVLFDPTGQNLDLSSRFDVASSDSEAVDELKQHLIESGFTAAPLVVAQWARGEFDLLVFGDVQVHTSAIAAPMVSGSGSSTWVERHLGAVELGAVTTVEIWSGAAADPTTNLGLGVVACAGFRMSLDFAALDPGPDGELSTSDPAAGHTVRSTPPVSANAAPGDEPAGEVFSADYTVADVSPRVVASVEPPVSAAARADATLAVGQLSDGVDTEDAEEAEQASDATAADGQIGEPTDQAASVPADPFTASSLGAPAPAPARPAATQTASDPFDRSGEQQTASMEPRAGLFEASHCPVGHANPPRGANCYVCGEPLLEDQSLGLIEQPAVGRIVFAGGQTLLLERPVVIGRKPDGAALGAHPVLIDHVEVSRSHAMISIEGWTVLLTDQGSRNGTWVVPANDPTPVRIDAHIPHVLEHGTTVHLGAPEVAFVYHFDAVGA